MPEPDEYYQEFVDFTGNESGEDFNAFMYLYEAAGAPDDIDTWFEFLNTFYPEDVSGQHDKQYWDDLRQLFYDYSGLTDDNIDWSFWREWIEANTP